MALFMALVSFHVFPCQKKNYIVCTITQWLSVSAVCHLQCTTIFTAKCKACNLLIFSSRLYIVILKFDSSFSCRCFSRPKKISECFCQYTAKRMENSQFDACKNVRFFFVVVFLVIFGINCTFNWFTKLLWFIIDRRTKRRRGKKPNDFRDSYTYLRSKLNAKKFHNCSLRCFMFHWLHN